MLRQVALIGLLLAVSGDAAARPTPKRPKDAITLGPYRYPSKLDHVAFTVTRTGKQMKVLVTATLSTPEKMERRSSNRALNLELPARARIIGLASTFGTRTRSVAAFEVEGEAWHRYVDHKFAGRDVAHADFRYASEGRAHYDINASRLDVGQSLVLEIEIEMQVATALVIESRFDVKGATLTVDGAPSTTVDLKGEYVPTRIPLPKATRDVLKAPTPAPAADAVGDNLSLLAEPAMPPRDDDVIVREVRIQARAHLDSMRACFPKAMLMWNVDVTFTVTPDGRASDVDATQKIGDPPDPSTKACLAGELSVWRFTKPSKPTPVSYRLFVSRH